MVADRAVVIAALHQRWESVLPGRTRLGAELIARWSEPHRHYHDLGHLSHALAALDLLGPASRSEEIALWFHDAVHTSSPGHDEQLSAALAAQELPAVGVEAAEVAEVVRLVLVTIDHSPAPGDAAGARVSDADLAILGAEPERYRVSVQSLRAEAAAMDEVTWRASRRAALAAFAATRPLFHTALGNSTWEGPARANLAAEGEDYRTE
jgi:predicted metal-dependent HD superfamily phosphohydrolase